MPAVTHHVTMAMYRESLQIDLIEDYVCFVFSKVETNNVNKIHVARIVGLVMNMDIVDTDLCHKMDIDLMIG